MPAAAGIKVHGLRELHRALGKADKETKKRVRQVERQIAEPVRVQAEELATREISHLGPEWGTMRIGITQRLVYVAPKRKRRQGTARPNLAGLLLSKAMEPALEQNRGQLEHDLEEALDTMAGNFNRG